MMKLRARYPYAAIDIALGSWNRSVAEKLGIFSNILVFDFFKKDPSVSPTKSGRELKLFLKNLGYYDIAVDFRWYPDTRPVLTRTNAGMKVGFATGEIMIDNMLAVSLSCDNSNKKDKTHEESISLKLVELVDKIPSDISYYLVFSELARKNDNNKSGAIAIFPYAGREIKEWGEKNFKILINMFCGNQEVGSINIYISGKPRQIWLDLIRERGKVQIYSDIAPTELFESLAGNIIAISNDSFGAHISSYLGLQTLVIFGGMVNPAFWAPAFGRSLVIYKPVPCSPCYLSKSKNDCGFKMACLEGINPETVYNKAVDLMRTYINKITYSY